MAEGGTNRVEYLRLTCAVAGQVATLTAVDITEAHPTEFALAAGGIVVNLTANVADFFKVSSTTGARYRVTFSRES
jgi:hypothetical protein